MRRKESYVARGRRRAPRRKRRYLIPAVSPNEHPFFLFSILSRRRRRWRRQRRDAEINFWQVRWEKRWYVSVRYIVEYTRLLFQRPPPSTVPSPSPSLTSFFRPSAPRRDSFPEFQSISPGPAASCDGRISSSPCGRAWPGDEVYGNGNGQHYFST